MDKDGVMDQAGESSEAREPRESGESGEPGKNPMLHPDEQPTGVEGSPKFGRLLVVLILTVLLIVLRTFGSEAYYS